jgi:predicted dehydrogenase
MAVGFVRGKWSRREVGGSSMLMAKCCHDLDLVAWMKSGIAPQVVSSLGGLMQYRPQRAPQGAGTRCMVDCRIEADCPYSARRLHVDRDYWAFYTWEGIEHVAATPTREQKIESMKTDNPFGRCVWRCDNNVVDHQAVTVQFADGCVATHTVTGGSARPCRSMHLLGSRGEIQGVMEEGCFVVRTMDPEAPGGYREEKVETDAPGGAHGGGDLLLVADFVRVIRGQTPSLSTTSLADSIYGARIGFAADESMEQKRSVWME